MLKHYIGKQLQRPHGLTGRFLLGPLWNRHNAFLNDRTLQLLRAGDDERILDVGFGGGYLLERLLGIVTRGCIAGLDAAPPMVRRALKKFSHPIDQGVLEIRLGAVEAMPFADHTFDKVSGVNTIFYWDDLCQGLREIYRVLGHHGLVVLTFTDAADLEKRNFAAPGIRTVRLKEVTAALRAADFASIEVQQDRDASRAFWMVCAAK